jgi:hypothetical protein
MEHSRLHVLQYVSKISRQTLEQQVRYGDCSLQLINDAEYSASIDPETRAPKAAFSKQAPKSHSDERECLDDFSEFVVDKMAL